MNHDHEWVVYWRCEHYTDSFTRRGARSDGERYAHYVGPCSRGRWVSGCGWCGEPGYPLTEAG